MSKEADIRKTDNSSSAAYLKRSLDTNEHDDVCDRRLNWIKTAIWLIISSVVLGGAVGWSQNEGMRSKNDTQDILITENIKDIGEIKGSLGTHIKEQQQTNKEMLYILNQMKVDLGVIKRGVQ